MQLAKHRPSKYVILQRPMEIASMIAGRDVDRNRAVNAAKPHECVPAAATDLLCILYTLFQGLLRHEELDFRSTSDFPSHHQALENLTVGGGGGINPSLISS